METELIELQRRVVALEAAQAAGARRERSDRSRRTGWAPVLGAGILAFGVVVTLARAAGGPPPLRDPIRVPAPFEVVDDKGRAIFRVQASASGDGTAIFYDEVGEECAIIGHGIDKPLFQVLKKGVLKGGLGISRVGAGLLRLDGAGESSTQLVGGTGVYLENDEGNTVVALGVDGSSNGFVQVMNRAGVDLSELAVAPDGSGGRISVSKPNEVTVLMGVLVNGKGDVCANGLPGKQVCLSGLAAKTFTKY
jgi:hypothetical protein